jgi:hypothetical protein
LDATAVPAESDRWFRFIVTYCRACCRNQWLQAQCARLGSRPHASESAVGLGILETIIT